MAAHATTLPFATEDLPSPSVETDEVLRVAQLAGAALAALRQEHDLSVEKASNWLHVSPTDLVRAEAGHFMEVTRRGRVVDMASVLLLLMASLLEQRKLRLPKPR